MGEEDKLSFFGAKGEKATVFIFQWELDSPEARRPEGPWLEPPPPLHGRQAMVADELPEGPRQRPHRCSRTSCSDTALRMNFAGFRFKIAAK